MSRYIYMQTYKIMADFSEDKRWLADGVGEAMSLVTPSLCPPLGVGLGGEMPKP